MKILSVVMTHTEALPTAKRHFPIWENLTDHLIFTSPKDKMMTTEGICFGYPEIAIGEAEHHGEKSAIRIIEIFNETIQHHCYENLTHILLMEYDSFVLRITDKVLPEPGGVSAILYPQNKPIKFKAKFYLHYPMLFTVDAFRNVARHLPIIKGNDRHFSDRLIGGAVELSKIPVKNLKKLKLGYSKNTIEHYNHPQLKEAVKNGAIFFHGVKTTDTLGQILDIPILEPFKRINET